MHRFFALLLLCTMLVVLPVESKVIKKNKMNRYDFSKAVIVTSDSLSTPAALAVQVLVEEVARRTGIQLPVQHEWPDGKNACIAVGKLPEKAFLQGTYKVSLSEMDEPGPEGYLLRAIVGSRQVCWIIGSDDRGLLYGVGAFLRSLHFDTAALWLSHDLEMAQTPAAYTRGCELNLSNTPGTNDIPAKMYIRELALFGANCITVAAPDFDSNIPAPLHYSEKLTTVSGVCATHDLDMWVKCTDEALVAENQQLATFLDSLPRLDAVFINNYEFSLVSPDSFFTRINAFATRLVERHPTVKIWLPLADGRRSAQLDRYYSLINTRPEWLGGVVAPSTVSSLIKVRQRIAAAIPIIGYPDIAHNYNCQLPVAGLDPAFALTLGQRFINPRPIAMAKIHQQIHTLTDGSITASAGLFDDFNKFIWLAREWDPKIPVNRVLNEYARFLVDDSQADGIAMGLLALEKNWQSPLAVNSQIPVTLLQWRFLEQLTAPALTKNFRFQMGLLRAYSDAASQMRLVYEMNVQHEAEAVLRKAADIGAKKAIKKALHIFKHQNQSDAVRDMENKCREIVKTIQNLPTEMSSDSFDTFLAGMHTPLNDCRWYTDNLVLIPKNGTESDRLAVISKLLIRTNPGMGGFYVNAGAASLTAGQISNNNIRYGAGAVSAATADPVPLAWLTQAVGTVEDPFTLTFENLNQFLKYKIRVVYPTSCESTVSLTASKKFKIHPLQKFDNPVQEFSVPRRAITHGRLTFSWTCGRGEAGAQVAEVWLFPEDESAAKIIFE